MFNRLKTYFRERTTIDTPTFRHIESFFKPLKTKRNEFLLTEGQICRHYYFVNKGCLRLFSINKDGEEGTRYFAFEGAFGTALPSFINQQPAFEYVQTIEPSELLVVGREDFYELTERVPQVGKIYRAILEAAFITAQQRIYGFQGLDGLEKLQWLLRHQPQILTRISNKLAASYLGMTPATLSRLKRKLWLKRSQKS